jgi:hypothetical protein
LRRRQVSPGTDQFATYHDTPCAQGGPGKRTLQLPDMTLGVLQLPAQVAAFVFRGACPFAGHIADPD